MRSLVECIGRLAGRDGRLSGGLFCILLFFLVYFPFKIKRNYRQRKELQKEFTFVTTDSSLNVEFANGHYNKPWIDYLKWKESRNLFLLYHADNLYQIIPKRCSHSAGDID
ncbi:MAG: hypothetical protein B7Z66_14655, partial [Chromatiales bacterium 21-64-14]